MTTDPSDSGSPTITSRAYHITIDEDHDSFFALSIERTDSDTAYLMSDTVRSLDEMR